MITAVIFQANLKQVIQIESKKESLEEQKKEYDRKQEEEEIKAEEERINQEISSDFIEESKCENCKHYIDGRCNDRNDDSVKPSVKLKVSPNSTCSGFDKGRIISKVNLSPEDIEKEFSRKKKEIAQLYRSSESKEKGVLIENIKDLLIDKYHFKSKMGTLHNQIYLYNNGIYEPNGKEVIASETENILKDLSRDYLVREIKSKIVRLTCNEDITSNKDLNLICVNNGVLDINNIKLNPHHPKHKFFNKFPIDYNANAKCKKIEKFLSEVFYKEDLDMIQEFVGYCLYRSYFIKKALILFGSADGGKSTFIDLLNAFIGKENISGISIHQLANSRFSAKFMYQKHLNIYDDLADKDIEDVGTFKMATGNSLLTAEHKFGDMFQFINTAKLLFSANKIPSPKNPQNIDEESYFGRWLCAGCDNKFNDSNENTDKFIINKLTTKEELSGFLNYAIIGLKRLLKNKKFSYKKDYKANQDIMSRSGNPMVAFAQDCCSKSHNSWISKEDLYSKYYDYCIKKDYPCFTKEKLGRSLPQFCKYVIDSWGNNSKTNTRGRGWRHIEVSHYTDFGKIKAEKV